MFTFIDGHLILAMIACPSLAILLVGLFNARQRRHAAQRQQHVAQRRAIFAARGGAR